MGFAADCGSGFPVRRPQSKTETSEKWARRTGGGRYLEYPAELRRRGWRIEPPATSSPMKTFLAPLTNPYPALLIAVAGAVGMTGTLCNAQTVVREQTVV